MADWIENYYRDFLKIQKFLKISKIQIFLNYIRNF